MIKSISDYEYLGNGLYKINSNMNELNIRLDNLFLEKEKWNSVLTIMSSLSSDLTNLYTTINTSSANWRNASSLVYATKGYWQEPIMIVYNKTFNCAANYLEIENWLNENFDPQGFAPEQILRCDFLCKNYNDEMLKGYRLAEFDPYTVEGLALNYNTTVKEVYSFLGLENQLNAILALINFFLKKNNKTSFIIDSIKDITNYENYVSYNRISNIFYSNILDTFREADLRAFVSYVYQYQIVYKTYEKYKELANIPKEVLKKFELKDISVTNGGNFYYKIINGRWTYYPYTHIEFCNNTICSDCYDPVNLNELYADKHYCFVGTKYILTECLSAVPYGESLSFSAPILVDIPEEEGYDMLSNLLS
jgi:hypothetical protein